MESIEESIKNISYGNIIGSIVLIIISVILYKVVVFFISKGERSNADSKANKKVKTYIRLIKNVLLYVFIVITVLLILQINGINVSSLLAGVGIMGAVIGLAIQDWLKDIIRGTSILSDNYFSVGDIIRYNGVEGKVVVIGLKTTKMQELKTGYIKSIANRKIEEVDIVSNNIYINVPMPYETQINVAENAIDDMLVEINKLENVQNCMYKGINELADSSIKYLIEITCNPQNKLQVNRDALRIILLTMANHKIEVPYNQIDVHQKNV